MGLESVMRKHIMSGRPNRKHGTDGQTGKHEGRSQPPAAWTSTGGQPNDSFGLSHGRAIGEMTCHLHTVVGNPATRPEVLNLSER